MHDQSDQERSLGHRLRAFEDALPVTDGPPSVRSRLSTVRTALIAVATIAIVAGGAAAGGVFEAKARPGAFNAGQPLHCKGVASMTPRQAATWLRDQGYDVTWQIEERDPGAPKGQQRSRQSDTPPAAGVIAAAVITGGSEMIVVVETGPGAIRAEDCP